MRCVPDDCPNQRLLTIDQAGVKLRPTETFDELAEVLHDIVHRGSLRRIVLHHALDKSLQEVGIAIFLTTLSTIA
jgi:hypothetical protein